MRAEGGGGEVSGHRLQAAAGPYPAGQGGRLGVTVSRTRCRARDGRQRNPCNYRIINDIFVQGHCVVLQADLLRR